MFRRSGPADDSVAPAGVGWPDGAVLTDDVRYLSRGWWRTHLTPPVADVLAHRDPDPPTTEGRA